MLTNRPIPASLSVAMTVLLVCSLLMIRPAAAQPESAPFDITLNHVALSVPDIDASIAWYREMFGFEEIRRIAAEPGSPMAIATIARGDVRIELFQLADAAPLPAYRRDPNEDLRTHGLVHFAFQVKNLREIVAGLQVKGVRITREITENTRSTFVFISDNAGNTFELIEPKE